MGKKQEEQFKHLMAKQKEQYEIELKHVKHLLYLAVGEEHNEPEKRMYTPLEGNIQVRGSKAHGSSKLVSATVGGSRSIEDTSWGLSNGMFSEVLSTAKDVRYKAYSVRDMAIQKVDSLTGGEGADLCEERDAPNFFMADLLNTLLDTRDALDKASDRLDNV